MPERFVQLRGASVNAREKWATHWLLGIFDTVGCPLIVYTDSSGLLCKIHRAQRSHGFGETAAVIHPPLPSRMLSWSEMAQEGARIHVEEADGDDDSGLIHHTRRHPRMWACPWAGR
jgi:hypothetical protein